MCYTWVWSKPLLVVSNDNQGEHVLFEGPLEKTCPHAFIQFFNHHALFDFGKFEGHGHDSITVEVQGNVLGKANTVDPSRTIHQLLQIPARFKGWFWPGS